MHIHVSSAPPVSWGAGLVRRGMSCGLAALLVFAVAWPAAAQRDPYQKVREKLVAEAIEAEGVKNPRVLQAMRTTPRHEFVPPDQARLAYLDMALPIGDGQTISPPFVVAYMTEQLDPQPDDKVLEIGTGSGYQAAVLSPLVKEVYTIEIVEKLGRRAADVLRKLKYENVHTKIGDGYLGWPEHAPFDKIIVTCSPEKIPQPLIDQLAEGGRMVIPLGERYQQSLYLYRKQDGQLVAEALVPTLFVPMTGKAEDAREKLPDPLKPSLVNGGFEDVHEESGKARGWHYQRQMTVAEGGSKSSESRAAEFTNNEPGMGAFALQAFAIDGRKVSQLVVSCRVRGQGIRPGLSRHELPGIVITYYDERRREAGEIAVGGWRGTFDWQTFTSRVRVPRDAREAIIRIGLHGSTGTIAFDDVDVKAP